MSYLPFASLRKALMFFYDVSRLSAPALNYEPRVSSGMAVDERIESAATIGFYLAKLNELYQLILKCRYGYLYSRHETIKHCREQYPDARINIHNITIHTRAAQNGIRKLFTEAGIIKLRGTF